jgi:DNA-binding transcriptional LysR family regulator
MAQDPWLGLEIRHLEALRAVAAERSFGRAGLKLGYAQSAVSAQIAALERMVGIRLFVRRAGSRSVELTSSGERLLDHAEAILSRLEVAKADIDSGAGERPLRVGVHRSAAIALLPTIMSSFTASHPLTDVDLTESDNERSLLSALEAGSLDLAFCFLPTGSTRTRVQPLLEDRYVVLSPGEPNHVNGVVTLAEIENYPFILLEDCSNQRRTESALKAQGVTLNVVMRVADTATAHALVGGGVGHALVPELSIVSDNRLLVRTLAAELPRRFMGIAWDGDRELPPEAMTFIAAARAAANGLTRSAA